MGIVVWTNFASNVRAIIADAYGVAAEVPPNKRVHLSLRSNVAWGYEIHKINSSKEIDKGRNDETRAITRVNMDTKNTSDPVSWLSLAKKHFKPKTIKVLVATTPP